MSEIDQTAKIEAMKEFRTMRAICFAALAVAMAIVLILAFTGHKGPIALDIGIVLIASALLFFNKYTIYIPRFLIGSIIVAVYLMLIPCFFAESIWNSLTSLLTGFVLGLIGIIQAHILLKKKPSTDKGKSNIITTVGFNFAVAVYALGVIIAFIRTLFVSVDYFDYMHMLMARSVFNAVGAMATCLLYYYGFTKGLFDKSIDSFLEKNAHSFNIEVSDEERVEQLILAGESYNLEFKSTLCTNLNTNKRDKRMEKAVLKTIVAFLNSDGGTLLVGVEDNGNILGVDVEAFANRDKMNLHINNLIVSQIGSEFVPFIRFRMVDFGKKENGSDRIVIIFDCTPTMSPVFFKDQKEGEEIYFVRSGPSTIELTGFDLLKYIDNRNSKSKSLFRKKKYLSNMAAQTEEEKPAETAVPEENQEKSPENKDQKV